MSEIITKLEDGKNAGGLSDIGSINDSENEERDSDIGGMSDKMEAEAPEDPAATVGSSGGNLDAGQARAIWVAISGFNKSAAVLEKANSKDGLMQGVCDAVENLKQVIASGPNTFATLMKAVIAKCDAYIEKKHPLMPKGKRRKKAVIELRNGLQSLVDCKDKDVVTDAVAMHEGFGSTSRLVAVNHHQKEEYSNQIERGMKEDTDKTTRYVKGLLKTNVDENSMGAARMAQELKNQNKIVDPSGKKSQKELLREWYNDYKDNNTTGKAIEPVLDIIMSKDPMQFMMDSPTSMDPVGFVGKFNFLQIAHSVSSDMQDYYDFRKSGQAKFNDNFEEVVAKVRLFNDLYHIYKNLADVILHPKFKGLETNAFNMLKYRADDIREINIRNKKNDRDIDTHDIMDSLVKLKDKMEESKFKFGNPNCLAEMMDHSRTEARDDMRWFATGGINPELYVGAKS